MATTPIKTVLVLGAASDLAQQAILQYLQAGYRVVAASRSTTQLETFAQENDLSDEKIIIRYFDSIDFDSHLAFYQELPWKPHIVLYAAGYLRQNQEVFEEWAGGWQMMQVNYAGAVSILNVIIYDPENKDLERIIGVSSLSGVRGRKSNFIYGSTKAAFTTYLAGLRQHLADRNIAVNVVISGYIRTKINRGLDLKESLMLEPEFVAKKIVNAGSGFRIVPGWKWKIIHLILRILPEFLVAKLP